MKIIYLLPFLFISFLGYSQREIQKKSDKELSIIHRASFNNTFMFNMDFSVKYELGLRVNKHGVFMG